MTGEKEKEKKRKPRSPKPKKATDKEKHTEKRASKSSKVLAVLARASTESFAAAAVAAPPEPPHPLLPPPECIERIAEDEFAWGSENHLELIRESVPWLIEALAEAPNHSGVKRAVRKALADRGVSVNLEAAEVFHPFREGVGERLRALGDSMVEMSRTYMASLNSRALHIHKSPVAAGDPEGREKGIVGQARLDCDLFMPLPPWDWYDPVAMHEHVWIHVVRMLALAINDRYARDMQHALSGVAVVSVADIKSFTRMLNKMRAVDDHRLSRRPRPSQNVDVNRCIAIVEDEIGMRNICEDFPDQYPIVKVKNGFDLSMEEAANSFHLRVIMITVRYQPNMTYGEVAAQPDIQRRWQEYVNEGCEPGIPHTRWKRQAQAALEWLNSPDLRFEQITTCAEVQCLLRPYYDTRHHMHELYKAYRAENGGQLQADFMRALPKEKPAHEGLEAETLWEAAEWGQAHTAHKLILDGGQDLDATDEVGFTPLHLAAKFGHADVARELMQAGARSIDQPDQDLALTPLLWAAQEGFAEVAQVLVEFSAHLDIADSVGHTPILFCAEYGCPDVAQVLVNAGVRSLDLPDPQGLTPLLVAIEYGHADVVKVLVGAGIRTIDTPDGQGFTPMLLAADKGFSDIAAILIEGQTKALDTPSPNGSTPLHFCSRAGHADFAKLLVDAGATSLDSVNTSGETPLILCAQFGSDAVALVLLQSGARSLDVAKPDGDTPLHVSAYYGNAGMAKILIEAGATTLNAVNARGASPLKISYKKDRRDAARALLEGKADLRAVTDHSSSKARSFFASL